MQEVLQAGNIAAENVPSEKKRRFVRTVAIPAAVFLLLDLVLKRLALHHVLNWSMGPIDLSLFLNTGIVFSLPVPKWIYVPIAMVLLLGLVHLLVKEVRCEGKRTAGLLLVVMGASSNLWDNLTLGATVDYLILFGRSALNLADLMIVIGVLLLLKRQLESR